MPDAVHGAPIVGPSSWRLVLQRGTHTHLLTLGDVPHRSFLPRIWVDSLVHDPDMLALIIRKFGPHHVMLGSDYPFPLGDMPTPGRSIEEAAAATLGLPAGASAGDLDARRQGLLWRNAAAFLKLSLLHP